MATRTAEDFVKRAREVRGKQAVWHSLWDDLARVMIPRLLGFSETVVPGESRQDEIFDGTPMLAARGFANAIAAMLRPEGQKWAAVKAEDPSLNVDEEARAWLEDSTGRLHAAFDNPKARMREVTGACDLSSDPHGLHRGSQCCIRPIHIKHDL